MNKGKRGIGKKLMVEGDDIEGNINIREGKGEILLKE